MDIGFIFDKAVQLYNVLWNMSFTIYGISFTYGEVVIYGLFLTVVIAFIKYMSD